MRRLLFVCARNRLRSPTAEAIFSGVAGLEAASAGTAPDAECVVSADLVEWADTIFCMEQRQKKILQARFPNSLQDRRLIVLGIPDRYTYMQEELVELLKAKILPLLR